MGNQPFKRASSLLAITLIIILACNLPAETPSPLRVGTEPPAQPENTQAPTAAAETPTAPVVHLITPAEVTPSGILAYDVESSGTAPEHRAPYGDSYNIYRFERPFTQLDMTYVPAMDIVTFRMGEDSNWYYPFVELIGESVNDPLNIDYGIEIDKEMDGHGEVLIWAAPPYTTQWSTDTVKVYLDTNHDTGGASSDKSDAPYPGNGYDSLIFDRGQGDDPDLAWVRINPSSPTILEFAYKKILSGHVFMWSSVADAGLKDPGKYYYNDRFTLEEAGSPLSDNLNYPIKALYLFDNTCRAAFGFNATGNESLICPTEPRPRATRAPGTQVPPPPPCIRDPTCVGCGYEWIQSECRCVYHGPC